MYVCMCRLPNDVPQFVLARFSMTSESPEQACSVYVSTGNTVAYILLCSVHRTRLRNTRSRNGVSRNANVSARYARMICSLFVCVSRF